MALKSKPYYWLTCDECDARSTEDSEYAAWIDEGQAVDDAQNWDWQIIDKTGKHYCPEHYVCTKDDDCPPGATHERPCPEYETPPAPGENP